VSPSAHAFEQLSTAAAVGFFAAHLVKHAFGVCTGQHLSSQAASASPQVAAQLA